MSYWLCFGYKTTSRSNLDILLALKDDDSFLPAVALLQPLRLHRLLCDTYDPSDGVVLASVSDHNVHVLHKDFNGDSRLVSSVDLASFREQFTQVDQPAAEAVLVKHFGYKPVSTGDVNMSPSRSAGMDHS